MSRTELTAITISTAVLIAVVFGVFSNLDDGIADIDRQKSDRAPQMSSADRGVRRASEVISKKTADAEPNQADPADEWINPNLPDAKTVRAGVRESAIRRVKTAYTLLLNNLGLASEQRDDMISFLVEAHIARTTTEYDRGELTDEFGRQIAIKEIIGEAKLEEFLVLEQNLREYTEVQTLQTAFERNGTPFPEARRDALFDILVETRSQYIDLEPPPGVEVDSMQNFEYLMNQSQEYHRHVLELAPSVLSPQQVQHLYERYEANSYEWQHLAEINRITIDDPEMVGVPIIYPAEF